MSASKDLFEANIWEANSFAAGIFRGADFVTVPDIPGAEYRVRDNSMHYAITENPLRYRVRDNSLHYRSLET